MRDEDGSLRVLLIEDDPEDAFLVEDALRGVRDPRFETRCAPGLREGIGLARDFGPDLLLVDLSLPDSFGLETVSTLREEASEIPIVVLTGTDDNELARGAVERGAQDYLSKGDLDGRLLVRAIRNALERHRSEAALKASEDRYRRLVEVSPDTVVVQIEGRIVYMNAAGLTLLGASDSTQVVGRPIVDIVHPDDRAAAAVHAILATHGEVVPFTEQRFVRLDGTPVDVEVAALPTVFDGVAATQVVVRDISERKHAEDERQRLEQQLLRAQKLEAVGRLAGGIAHDFNNMLTVITGRAQLLNAKLDAQSAGAEFDPARVDADEILRAAKQAAEITQQLLTFSSQKSYQDQLVDLNEIVTNAERMLRPLIRENIASTTLLATTASRVCMDPAQIEQVIVNLIINACDAMPDGGALVIETSAATVGDAIDRGETLPPGRYVRVAVSDTGTGMDAETCARVFDPFFTTKGPEKGTGLGLATVYGVVTQGGGSINVRSELGQGTTFEILLPETAAAPASIASSEQPVASGGTETILLVEDDPAVRALSAEVLTSHGYTVIALPGPTEAIAHVGDLASPIALLVTDVVMPEMSGPQLAAAIEQLRPGLPVVLMSGYTNGEIERHGPLAAGIVILQKPFGTDQLAIAVRTTLDAASRTLDNEQPHAA